MRKGSVASKRTLYGLKSETTMMVPTFGISKLQGEGKGADKNVMRLDSKRTMLSFKFNNTGSSTAFKIQTRANQKKMMKTSGP